jgi:hypothetical protein
MNGIRNIGRRTGEMLAAAYVCLLLAAPAAWAQCQMCREAAASQKQEAIAALQNGILILGAPPLAIGGGIIWLTYRNRNRFHRPQQKDEPAAK